jgi:hypothetical protein
MNWKLHMDLKTEDQIERWVEIMIDRLDMKYSIGRISTDEYNKEVKKISKQADNYYDSIQRPAQEQESFYEPPRHSIVSILRSSKE